MASRAARTRPSLHPGLCPTCHGAGVSGVSLPDAGVRYCAACHGHGVVA
jgi:DnaJ-class molecular chaperone